MTRAFLAVPLALVAGAAASDPVPDGVLDAVASGAALGALPLPDMVEAPLARLAPPAYADADGAPAGADRPSPRELSNALAAAGLGTVDAAPLSNLAVGFSQLMASHEIARSPTVAGPDGALDLPVAADDPVAQLVGGLPVMRQQRSRTVAGTLEQVNDVTTAFDGSVVYGSTAAVQALLRENDGTGRMRTDPDGRLPVIAGRPKAGDVRADENVPLKALHDLFLREHNRLADGLREACAAGGRDCSGDEVFAAAKHANAALQAQIFYDEYLPLFLGADDLATLVPDRSLLQGPPQAINAFTAAAGRLGHTQVPDDVSAHLPGEAPRTARIADCLFVQTCVTGESLDAVIFGASQQAADAIDVAVTDGLRNAQRQGFGQPVLIDLLATNVNRGRDHGLPSYAEMRAALGFADGGALPAEVEALYAGASGVDLLVGLMAEDRPDGAYLGETGAALWAVQFERLRPDHAGDPFAALYAGRTMADVIAANTGLSRAQAGDPFRAAAAPSPVPLPPAMALGLLGLLALAAVRGRR